jgi:hypothetical protein
MTEDRSDTLRTLKEDVKELRDTAIEHRLRLENGSLVFTQLQQAMPKPMSPGKLVSIAFGVFITAAGALWALSNMLRDRPTIEQLREVIDTHDASGHTNLRESVRDIQVEQGQQKERIETVQTTQNAANTKLDAILKRMPPRRGPP